LLGGVRTDARTGGKQPIFFQTAGAATLKTGGKKGNHGPKAERPLAGLTYEYPVRRRR